MKVKYLFLSMCAALAMTGCSNEEDINPGNNGNGETNYLYVSLVSTPETGTKATAGDNNPTGAEYENGTDTENKVSNVRFYFFNEDGTPAVVKKNSQVNYIPATPNPESGTEPVGPVEKILESVLLIENDGSALPAKLVAVLNPEGLPETSLSLDDLRKEVANYADLANAETPKFVMCNSVYADNKVEIPATAVAAANYRSTADLAKANPVYVYVERNVAKVAVTVKPELYDTTHPDMIKVTTDGTTPLTVKDGETDKQVYVKLLGWDVTGDLSKAWLSKSIDGNWTNTALFGSASIEWNWAPYYRSFWAKECTATGNTNIYKNYNKQHSNSFTDGYTYCNENAERTAASTKNPTQVIIPAMLCDEAGNALTIYEYATNRYIDDAANTNFKKLFLSQLESKGVTYYKTNGEGRKKISEEDVEIITVTDAGDITEGAAGAYRSRIALKTGTGYPTEWFTSETGTETVTATALANEIKKLESAKVWNSGMTYYYFDILHLGNSIGVVRNHCYKMNIETLYGLGTPVYDPDETIYPEHPVNDESYIAAKIKILSWRVVKHGVSLEW